MKQDTLTVTVIVAPGAAVAEVVAADYQIAVVSQKTGHSGITVNVFGHAVDDLHDGPDISLRLPNTGPDAAHAAGIVVKISDHAAHPMTS